MPAGAICPVMRLSWWRMFCGVRAPIPVVNDILSGFAPSPKSAAAMAVMGVHGGAEGLFPGLCRTDHKGKGTSDPRYQDTVSPFLPEAGEIQDINRAEGRDLSLASGNDLSLILYPERAGINDITGLIHQMELTDMVIGDSSAKPHPLGKIRFLGRIIRTVAQLVDLYRLRTDHSG